MSRCARPASFRRLGLEALEDRTTPSAGVLDATFSGDGRATVAFPSRNSDDAAEVVVVQLDGRVLVAGQGGNNFAVARFNRDGSLDATFGTGGKLRYSFGPITGLAV